MRIETPKRLSEIIAGENEEIPYPPLGSWEVKYNRYTTEQEILDMMHSNAPEEANAFSRMDRASSSFFERLFGMGYSTEVIFYHVPEADRV